MTILDFIRHKARLEGKPTGGLRFHLTTENEMREIPGKGRQYKILIGIPWLQRTFPKTWSVWRLTEGKISYGLIVKQEILDL